MKKRIRSFIRKHIDYRIVGEYLDHDGYGNYKKKYRKKYYFKW